MKTEVEFAIKFSFDPTKPVETNELLILEGFINLARSLHKDDPKVISDQQILFLDGLREQAIETAISTVSKNFRLERKGKRHKLAMEAMRQNGGNKLQAAKTLGISRATIYVWLNEKGTRIDF